MPSGEETIEQLWEIIVMLKRELDPHKSDPAKLELPRSAWEEAVKRCEKIFPERCH